MPDSFNINKYPKTKKYLLLYFHVHQPFRLNNYYSPFDVPDNFDYFGGTEGNTNDFIINRVAERCYRPAGEMFLKLAQEAGLKISYSFTGTVLEQLHDKAPDVIELYQKLHDTGKMEVVCETHYHSLAAFYDLAEFARQVETHCQELTQIFGKRPEVFRNTELTYRNDVGEFIRQMGFKAAFAEGWDPILQWRSSNYMYRNKPVEIGAGAEQLARDVNDLAPAPELKLLLKNYRRSDDVAFRFQLKGWEGYPVTADKFARWVAEEPGYLTTLCMDYETVGEHHRVESGIFEFYKYLPQELAKQGIEFILPSEAEQAFDSEEELDYPQIVSWADAERDLSAWTGNEMQQKALQAIYQVGDEVKAKLSKIENVELRMKVLDVWGKLQTSDHYYYMSTKYWSDGDVHRYFSPYETPFQANINFLNVLSKFREELRK